MYFLSILAVILSSFLMLSITEGSFGLALYYFDFFTIIVMLVIIIPILISTNLLKDFNNAFKLVVFKKKVANLSEIKRAIEAIELTMKVSINAGLFTFLFSIIIILAKLNDYYALGPNIAVAILTILYAFIINLLLLPIKSKLKVMLFEFIEE